LGQLLDLSQASIRSQHHWFTW